MFPKRIGSPIQCYLGGEKLGEKTPQEWASELGIKVQTIYVGKSSGGNVLGADGKKYRFYNTGITPPKLPPVSLADVDAVCKAEGKAYGRMQTEILNGRTITPEEAEEARRKIKGEKPAESTEMEEKEKVMEEYAETMKPAEISLSDFVGMTDETTVLVYRGSEWVFTAPSTSTLFTIGALAGTIDSFQPVIVDDAACLKVWVK